MIRIVKPLTIPEILEIEGAAADKKNRLDYDADKKSIITINNAIYGHATVKKVLKSAQHNKCCFCEKDQVDEYGAVEHFRPKKGYKSSKKDKLNKPGYYWLGYVWNNLFFVCSSCNSAGNKGNLFPLLDESKRAKSHNDDVTEETSLLIDPSGPKDPRQHINFDSQFPKGITIYGRATISICGLDRDALNDKRKKLIDDIELRILILAKRNEFKKRDVDKAIDFIKNSQKPEAEFSSAAIDYISQFNIQLN